MLTDFKGVLQEPFKDTKIQLVFFDPWKVGTLELKDESTVNADDYIAEWKINHPTGNQILMFFRKNERTSQTYTFKKIAVTKNLEDKQLFPIVTNYIQDNIMNTGDEKTRITNGINALKNAFDPWFKNQLTTYSVQLLNNSYYYKGYAYIPFCYYTLDASIITDEDYIPCEKLVYLAPDGNYYDLYKYDDNSTAIINSPATLYDINFQNLIGTQNNNFEWTFSWNDTLLLSDLGDVYVKLSSSEYTALSEVFSNIGYNYFDFSTTTKYNTFENVSTSSTLYSKLNEISNNTKQFKDWKYRKEAPRSPLLYYDYDKKCSSQLKIFTGTINSGEAYEEKHGLSRDWNGPFSEAKRTYCDCFALDLSNKIFPNFPLNVNNSPGTTNIEPNMANPTNFKEIPVKWTPINDKNKSFNKIWNYIDAGYIIYFVHAADHIETGYPRDSESLKHVIGAGSPPIGIKGINSKFMKNLKKNGQTGRGVKAFIYLGILKNTN